jgi:hypothetical protein
VQRFSQFFGYTPKLHEFLNKYFPEETFLRSVVYSAIAAANVPING